MAFRSEKLRVLCEHLAADFFNRESSGASLITVTGSRLSPDGKYVTIFFTVLPEHKEPAALDFAKRRRGEFKEYVMNHAKIGRIPFFDFAIDEGEKNRQKIERLAQEDEERHKKAT